MTLAKTTDARRPIPFARRSRAQRTIRLFVSSTFRDLREERELLAKRVFPELRALCESRGVTWTEVDLRWGIPDEQSAEGRVLPTCLAEIERCRPYFIGLLGDRYGWVPEQIEPEILETAPWLKDERGKSITELEIQHGVLNDPGMAQHAFFYFRASNGGAQEVADSEKADKVAALKDRIRAAYRDGKLKNAPREDYADANALVDLVRQDLRRTIDAAFPEDQIPDRVERETSVHDSFGASRAMVYVPREQDYRVLDQHLASDRQPLVLIGESGAGKSALVANWVRRVRQMTPDLIVVEHYVGASVYSADWTATARRLLETLGREMRLNLTIPDQPRKLPEALASGLHHAAAKARFLLVIDGLNQLEDRDQAPDLVWFPSDLPPNARVVMSTLPGRALTAIQSRGWPTWNVQLLDVPARRQLIREYLRRYGKQLDQRRIDWIAEAEPTQNALFLTVLLDEIRQWGEHETLDECIVRYLTARKPDELYGKVLERWERDFERDHPGLVAQAMRLFWAARIGLSEQEILDMLNHLPRAIWSPLYLAAETALINRGGQVAFAHEYLRSAVQERYLSDDGLKGAAHEQLAAYFWGRPIDTRKLDELPWQLVQCEQWRRLYDVLSDLEFFGAAWRHNQYEVMEYWAQVECHTELSKVEGYRGLIAGEVELSEVAWGVAKLLSRTGHLESSMAIVSCLEGKYLREGSLSDYAACLGNRAAILQVQGLLDEAMTLHQQEERICRQLGDLKGLQGCLNNQAAILHTRGRLDEAVSRLRESECICRQYGNLDGLQSSLNNQATILRERGRLAEAMVLHEEEERICRQVGNLDGLEGCLGSQAVIRVLRGQLDEALVLLSEQERICRQLGNPNGLLASLGNQALILQDRGELDEAMRLHREEERICRQVGNLNGLQKSFGNQALALRALGRLDEAMQLLSNQEGVCRQLGNLNSLQLCLGNQALISKAHGQLDRAMLLHKEEERICRELGNLDGLQKSLGNQALILQDWNRLDEAMVLHQQEESICRELGNVDALQKSLGNQGLIHLARSQLDEAMRLFREKERISRELGNADALQSSLGNQGLVCKARGHLDQAMALLQEQERICKRIGNLHSLQTCLGNQGTILMDRGRPESAMSLFEQQERICKQLGNPVGMVASLVNRALILADRGQFEAACRLAEDGERVARDHGLTALLHQVLPIVEEIRGEMRR